MARLDTQDSSGTDKLADFMRRPIDEYPDLTPFLPSVELGPVDEPLNLNDIREVEAARWLLGETDKLPPDNRISSSYGRLVAASEASDASEAGLETRWRAVPVDDLINLIYSLRNLQSFSYGRLIAEKARKRDDIAALDQKGRRRLLDLLVTCTYMDPEAPPRVALSRATGFLHEMEFGRGADGSVDGNALSLAGAIEKRWWEVDGNIAHLERALGYYYSAFDIDAMTAEDGYPGVNAAFLLDLIAFIEGGGGMHDAARSGLLSPSAEVRRRNARRIRETIVALGVEAVEKTDNRQDRYWLYATMLECLFGLGRVAEAAEYTKRFLDLAPPRWVLRSSARQLGQLLRIQRPSGAIEADPALFALRAVSPGYAIAVRSAYIGKVGIALSGGGFRASLYHIGVFARLAEHDLLRHVEVLSCVSGGSIVGAHYYLELRNLLQRKADSQITREDYIDIVKRMEQTFLEGVQTDLRDQLLADRRTNWEAATNPRYTRTHRLGELFEEHLFSHVPDGQGKEPRFINALYIEPKLGETAPLYTNGEPAGDDGESLRPFNPRLDNWTRSAKSPILILNATTLNTGHSWQFTASWMGEPPAGYDPLLESMPRLRRVYYGKAPEPHRNVRLGHAVVASACVPGLFEPLALHELYPGLTVSLADGGVHDNQGIASLLEQQCRVVIISDASGQITLGDSVGDDPFTVALRANAVLMARVRESQFSAVRDLQVDGVLMGVLIAHLRQGLRAKAIDWDPARRRTDDLVAEASPSYTPYGVRSDVQRRLAELRTDLDAFHDLEGRGLMESGYRAVDEQIPHCFPGLADPNAPLMAWRFRAAGPALQTAATDTRVVAELERGARLMGKVYSLPAEAMKVGIAAVVLLIAFAGLVWSVERSVATTGLYLLAIPGGVLLLSAAVHLALRMVHRLRPARKRASLWGRVSGGFFAFVGAWWAERQLRTGLARYLDRGRLDPLPAPDHHPAERPGVTLPAEASLVPGIQVARDIGAPSARTEAHSADGLPSGASPAPGRNIAQGRADPTTGATGERRPPMP
jgi:predicted acylesterase/phospholipase RssA